MFPFSRSSIFTAGPIQPHMQRIQGYFPGVQLPEREVNLSPPSSEEIKMSEALTVLLRYAIMVSTETTIGILVRRVRRISETDY